MERSFAGVAAPSGLSVVFADPDAPGILHLAGALQGCQVAMARSAVDALRAVTMRHAHILITELDLPDQSGVELIRRIHTEPLTREVLLVVLTRRTSIASKVSAFQAGADDYLVKPVAVEDFVLHLRRILRFRQVLRS